MNYDCSPTDDQRLRKRQACTRQDFDHSRRNQPSKFAIRSCHFSNTK
jgi:hypothetical protein